MKLRYGLLMFLTALLMVPASLLAQREVHNFNREWRFAQGEQTGSPAEPGFDDAGWKHVRLPHDWAISGPFDPEKSGNSGKLPWQDLGWYRKTFHLESKRPGTRVYFDFDGVMAFPKVYVNGRLAGEWDYGYTSFRVDATPYVKFDENNVIAVHVDTRKHGTRWYPGAGIYRKVTMTIAPPLHIAQWGVFLTTPNVTDARATIRARSKLEYHGTAATDVNVEVVVLDPDGRPVASAAKTAEVPANGVAEVDQQMFVPKPRRWDIDAPNLYTAVTTVRRGGEVVDVEKTAFGIRTFEFTANDGFILNGRRVQLKGVNLHHDHGPLGAAFNTRAMERQLEIMQDMGVNALRTSHNPPAPEVLDLCDRMGIVVWDEAFDKWDATADLLDGPAAIKEHADRHLDSLVKRDRNHPSVVVWSIGNEIGNSPDNKGDGKSFDRVESMRNSVRKHDTTRPVAIGCHIPGTVDDPILEPLDLTGWNYMRRYARMREMYPEKHILYSESASTVSTRGYYVWPLANSKTDYPGEKAYVSSYDLSAAAWSDIPDAEFQLMEEDAFVGGEYVWTGFDYLGEPTPFVREARSSYFGIVDLVGIPKDRYYLYRSHWRPDATTIHMLPHWNWPNRIGQTVPVFVYTNGDSAELFLNGKSLGRRTKGNVPGKPEDLAAGKAVAVVWSGAGAGYEVDLQAEQPIKFLSIGLAPKAANAGYEVKISSNHSTWQTVVREQSKTRSPAYFTPRGPVWTSHHLDAQGRYVRVEFPQLDAGVTGGVSEMGVYPAWRESDYYDVTYKYRLRWNDVVYEPGELRVVVYKGGTRLGEATMRTAGHPARIRLTPERTSFSTTGEDLAYILAEALDDHGTPCPLADNLVRFELEGPAEIAGVGNGDQLSYEPFQADYRKLFFGKAMLIVRTREGEAGTIRITARAEGLQAGTATVTSSAGTSGR